MYLDECDNNQRNYTRIRDGLSQILSGFQSIFLINEYEVPLDIREMIVRDMINANAIVEQVDANLDEFWDKNNYK